MENDTGGSPGATDIPGQTGIVRSKTSTRAASFGLAEQVEPEDEVVGRGQRVVKAGR